MMEDPCAPLHAAISASSILPGSFALITDTIHASGAPLLMHLMKRHLATSHWPGEVGHMATHEGVFDEMTSVSSSFSSSAGHRRKQQEAASGRGRVCFLAGAQSFEHYCSISRKMGFSMKALMESGRLVFVDLLSAPFATSSSASDRDGVASKEPESEGADVREGGQKEEKGGLRGEGTAVSAAEGGGHNAAGRRGGIKGYKSFSCAEPWAEKNSGRGRHGHGAAMPGMNPLRSLFLLLRDLVSGRGATGGEGTGAQQGRREEEGAWGVFVDDVLALELLGGGHHGHVLDFLHYVRTLQPGGQKVCLVLMAQQDPLLSDRFEDDYEKEAVDEMFEGQDGRDVLPWLLQAADLCIDVMPLSTGQAVDIHGEIEVSIQSEDYVDRSEVLYRPKSSRYLFQVKESGPLIFSAQCKNS